MDDLRSSSRVGADLAEGFRRIQEMNKIASRACTMANEKLPFNLDVNGAVSFYGPAMCYLAAPDPWSFRARQRARHVRDVAGGWPSEWQLDWYQPSECPCCNLRIGVGLLLHEILRMQRIAERALQHRPGHA